jgi:subtilase family serine protease
VGQNAIAGQNDFTGTYLSQLVVSDPASQPFATAVGGAYLPDLTDPSSATAWNNGPFSSYQGNAATGGGLSQMWAMPTWQWGVKDDTDELPTACGLTGTSRCREVPDVAGLADRRNGEVIYCTSSQCRQLEANFPGSPPGWFLADGTSFAAPQWAALVALAAQSVSGRRVGLITPRLYQLAAGQKGPFVPVQQGNNTYLDTNNDYGVPNPTCSYGPTKVAGPCYQATAGYNLATGLGLPDASVLVPRLRASR